MPDPATESSQDFTDHRELVVQALQKGEVLSIETIGYRADERRLVTSVLETFLHELESHDGFAGLLTYSLNEVATNAWKANVKRAWFESQGLNIDDPGHYEAGMEKFRTEVLGSRDLELLKSRTEPLYIRVHFHFRDDEFLIVVRNNSQPTEQEMRKIEERLKLARTFDSISDVLDQIEDTSEGAGLGLFTMLTALKNKGFSEDAFRFFRTDQETVVAFRLRHDQGFRRNR